MIIKTIYKKITKSNGFWIRPFLCIKNHRGLNANANMFRIQIYQGAINTYNEDEMALLIGHELAHWANWDSFRFFKDNHQKEFDADELGAKYMVKAGYNLKNALSKFDKMGQRETKSHPHPQERKKRLM